MGSVGECIDGSKYFKKHYVEALTTGIARPLSNDDNYVDEEKLNYVEE